MSKERVQEPHMMAGRCLAEEAAAPYARAWVGGCYVSALLSLA